MNKSELFFDLPAHLIANQPSDKRGDDRMLVVDRANKLLQHNHFNNLVTCLPAKSLLVFNNSKVRKGRLFGQSANGAQIEFLLLQKRLNNSWLCLVSKANRQKLGQSYTFEGGVTGQIIAEEDAGLKLVQFDNLTDDYLENYGHIPLPPYIKRQDSKSDAERYQTVYADKLGSAAAPTAGLHFTPEILTQLTANGFEQAFVTLHVGLGTFAPIREENITNHKMHSENYEISPEAAAAINKAIKEGRPIVAVGTTSLRLLESAANPEGFVEAGNQSTNIFIYGDYKFKIVKALFTNFHTPESTLLALVQCFTGKDLIMQGYREAIEQQYKFFSYGDCMLIK
ncbi:MAG: tRNA preQ1(34) S-adenosylmethionine ribosyltransferase-isomerase QueA [Spirochaetaceae bacterium]|nr:tRNA preQ1(34) S-adenosylmethionine ribosyltransferase-isomerase QueA [Spirochaetaceae bacterium]